jgi:hypothetical protein
MYDISTKTLKDRRELLKIKTLSLMVEVALIRREEAKQRKFTRKHAIDPALQREMYLHRTKDLRPVQRQTHVARGFIKGKTLPQMEQYPINLLTEKDWAKITAMVAKYGNKEAIAHTNEQMTQYANKVYATKPPHVNKPKTEKVWPFPQAAKVEA